MLIPSTQHETPLDIITEDDIVKHFAKEGKKFVQRLKPAVSYFDEYSIVSSQVMLSVSLILTLGHV